jgi:hypothetical protein
MDEVSDIVNVVEIPPGTGIHTVIYCDLGAQLKAFVREIASNESQTAGDKNSLAPQGWQPIVCVLRHSPLPPIKMRKSQKIDADPPVLRRTIHSI